MTVDGDGTVVGDGIDCGADCTGHYDADATVDLYAIADPGASFEGWGGDCAVFNLDPWCTLVMDTDKGVSARFSSDQEPVPSYPLNDTGIDWCADADSHCLDCPVAGYPGQDAESGRDVTHNDDSDGHAGFSFTKISNSGQPLPASAALGGGPNDWACTRDNVTGLIWEVKTDDGGLRDKDWTYSWYNPDPTMNGGSAGYADYGDDCFDSARCDTDKYVADVNARGLCGASDWRLASRDELLSITSNDRYAPAIDTAFFPNTLSSRYWSSSPYAYFPGVAWTVDFYYGDVESAGGKANPNYVRLVRGGQ